MEKIFVLSNYEEDRYCAACGARNSSDASYCSACGKML